MKQVVIFKLFIVFFLSSSTSFGQNEEKRKESRRPQARSLTPERMLQALDKDNDGKISKTEAPERMQERFAQMDENGDGFVQANELKKVFEMRSRRGGQNPEFDRRKQENTKNRGSKDSDGPKPDSGQRRSPSRVFDIEKIFKEMDQDGDGNLNPQEQQAVIAKFKQLQSRMRQRSRSGGDAEKKKSSNRNQRPDTDPVKPKRPGMQD
jgi:Ca2+-binding EF-hand superfamily protein